MAFRLPEFPLECDIYRGPWLTRALAEETYANFVPGRRGWVVPDRTDPDQVINNGPFFLLLPPGTDIRDRLTGLQHNDVLECPSGSGCWFGVASVAPVAWGFENMHVEAMVYKVSDVIFIGSYPGVEWPSPLPDGMSRRR